VAEWAPPYADALIAELREEVTGGASNKAPIEHSRIDPEVRVQVKYRTRVNMYDGRERASLIRRHPELS
jgi:hypothetical protein